MSDELLCAISDSRPGRSGHPWGAGGPFGLQSAVLGGPLLWIVGLSWGGEPIADDRILWYGSDANLPGVPELSVAVPEVTARTSAQVVLTELLIVDAEGKQTRVPLGVPNATPNTSRRIGLVFDHQLPNKDAQRMIAAESLRGTELFAVLRPSTPPQPRPSTKEIDARRAELCFVDNAAETLAGELARIGQSCPAGASALPQLAAGWDLASASKLLADCPGEQTAALALIACLWDRGIYWTDATFDGTRVVLVKISSIRSDGLWGDLWANSSVSTLPPNSVRVFHHSELEVKKRVNPPYPEEARALLLGDQRCLLKVFIDETGAPFDVLVEACPKVFHEAAKAAMLQWRWVPPKDGKTAIRAQTTLALTFKVSQ